MKKPQPTKESDVPEEFVTVSEISQRWKTSEWPVRQAIWSGRLAAVLFGSRLRVRRDDLLAFENENRWSRELCQQRTARPHAGRPKRRTRGPGKES